MRTTLAVSVIAVILSSVFICGSPVLAASTGTVSPTSESFGTVAASDLHIQQELDDAVAQMKAFAPRSSGTASESSAALYQAPFLSNPGTLSESAKTTALSTSTYHQ
jgi:hypothetical protein